MKKYIGIIPARYESTRFPGKPLAMINGKSMIRRVYERSSEVFNDIIVATDDKRIFDEVNKFNGKAVMTDSKHKSGTDRCREALDIFERESGNTFDVVVNVQGDEPFIKTSQLKQLISCFDEEKTDIATLIKPIEFSDVIFDSNRPKVVISKSGHALYFSRSPIPYLRGHDSKHWLGNANFYQHIGIYAYKSDVLRQITILEQSQLEKAESLEQLRWLENGYTIKTALTDHETYGIDTPEDLEKALKLGLI